MFGIHQTSPAAASQPLASKKDQASSGAQHEDVPEGVARLLDRYASVPLERTRNFCIIAHIDHGKSSLADKILETTGNIAPVVKGQQQVLDSLEIERQRGITVKAQTASVLHTDPDSGEEFLINLIDTPGHVDFAYEVERSLAACQGALLLVDCTQGVQAQTVANMLAAQKHGLRLIPVLTKIDLPNADPEPALDQLASLGLDPDEAIWTSAKTGEGCDEVVPAVVKLLPNPGEKRIGAAGAAVANLVPASELASLPCRALLFDSWFDDYRGVVCLIQLVEGSLKTGQKVSFSHSGQDASVSELGLVTPARHPVSQLTAGQVGYIITGVRDPRNAMAGDTVVEHRPAGKEPVPPLDGFAPSKPMVFASLYPVDESTFEALQRAVERLCLTDSSVTFRRESSSSLGFGLRCGFLGLLHMEVFHQRLQQEFDTPVIVTAPMVPYRLRVARRVVESTKASTGASGSTSTGIRIVTVEEQVAADLAGQLRVEDGDDDLSRGGSMGGVVDDEEVLRAREVAANAAAVGGAVDDEDGDPNEVIEVEVERPDDFPVGHEVVMYKEPLVRASVMVPADRLGPVMSLMQERRGRQEMLRYLDDGRTVIRYLMPWQEVVTDFFDKLQSCSAGYASFDYEPAGYGESQLSKVDILVNQDRVDALSFVSHRSSADAEGRRVIARLKKVIKRQQFEIRIQAAIGAKVFAKDRIPPYRKDVLSRSGKTVGGGDITRKRKLLEKQKRGKARMRKVGGVSLSQEAFHSVMSRGN